MVSSRHDRSGPQPPGQRAVNAVRGTAYRAATAASAKRLPYASNLRQQSRADTTRTPRSRERYVPDALVAMGHLLSRPQDIRATTPAGGRRAAPPKPTTVTPAKRVA